MVRINNNDIIRRASESFANLPESTQETFCNLVNNAIERGVVNTPATSAVRPKIVDNSIIQTGNKGSSR